MPDPAPHLGINAHSDAHLDIRDCKYLHSRSTTYDDAGVYEVFGGCPTATHVRSIMNMIGNRS